MQLRKYLHMPETMHLKKFYLFAKRIYNKTLQKKQKNLFLKMSQYPHYMDNTQRQFIEILSDGIRGTSAEKYYENVDWDEVLELANKHKVEGISHIEKGAIKSKASQKIKSILFDKTSEAIANPILKIDCDDIEASHACAIGSLNDDHLFYLLSRGIALEDAKKLITYGYLNPIVNYFLDEEKEELENLIKKEF